MILIVGAPVRQSGRLFNAAVVMSHGRICGVVPKTYLPNTQEFYEERIRERPHAWLWLHDRWKEP